MADTIVAAVAMIAVVAKVLVLDTVLVIVVFISVVINYDTKIGSIFDICKFILK